MLLESFKELSPEMQIFFKWYQGLLHAVPWLCTVFDLYMTDMALEKSHWWIAVITMCPCYMVCNWWGAMNLEGLEHQRGSVYGPEQWKDNIPLTIFYFVIIAAFQGGIFYCTAAIIDRVWPKRPEEEFDLEKDNNASNALN